MTQGIEFLETIYRQLHEAGIVRSKGEFSERLLGKSPSYLTSMRAKQRVISSEIIVGLGDNLVAEIAQLRCDQAKVEIRQVLRRAVAQVNNYLVDQTIPAANSISEQPASDNLQPPTKGLFNWLRALLNRTRGSSAAAHRQHLSVASSDEPTGVPANRC